MQVVDTTDRAAVGALITMPQYVDVIVPRGGKGLIARLMAEATVPMIKHLDGICHVYIDAKADLAKALPIAFNAKCHRYGTCNTMETLLVGARDRASGAAAAGRAVRDASRSSCAPTRKRMRCWPATRTWRTPPRKTGAPNTWRRSWRSRWSAAWTRRSTTSTPIRRSTPTPIITEDYSAALRFLREVDSASVMVNASTRFADGFEYGLGAEIGISNDKLHARGPVGLEGLTSLKYVVFGHGEVRN